MKETLYKLLALLALSAALGLGLVTIHFSLGEADITVMVNQIPKNISANIVIPIVETQEVLRENNTNTLPNASYEPKSALARLRKAVLGTSTETDNFEKLDARVKTLSVFVEHSISGKGEGVAADDYAHGIATIYNEQAVDQPLIEKTRLATPDKSVFRIQNRVTVPARGNIDVNVKADKKGAAFNLEPTSFTIPGLSLLKQQLVYAKNAAVFTGGERRIYTLTDDDFILAKKEAEDLLKEQALEQFNSQNIAISSKNIILEQIIFKTSDEVGEEKSELALSAETQADAVLFNEQELYKEMQRRLGASISNEEEIIGFNNESFTYTLVSLDKLGGVVRVNGYIEGFTSLKKDAQFIAPAELADLSAKEIQTRILTRKGISEVRVRFSPFWLTRAPRIAGKIHITVQEEGK